VYYYYNTAGLILKSPQLFIVVSNLEN
jgi:hypothetical protein